MKKCIAEIMKDIKELEEQKTHLIQVEYRDKTTTYSKGEEPQKIEYDFKATHERISEIDNRVRSLRFKLSQANTCTQVESFHMSLGECLVHLSQLSSCKLRMTELCLIPAMSKSLSRSGIVEYTVANFNKDDAKVLLDEVTQKIKKLQLAIDKTNLTTELEIQEL